MKAAVVEQPGKLVVREAPDLSPDPYQSLVRIEACCICNGTDRKVVDGTFPDITARDYPGILGHESVGTVVEVGSRVSKYRVGDRVLRPRAQYPDQEIKVWWGGFAEYGLVTDGDAYTADNPGCTHTDWAAPSQQILSPHIETGPATMFVTLKETLSWMHKLDVGAHTTLLVFGTGPVALSFCELAKALGSPLVAVVGRRDEALARARDFGADEVINSMREDVGQKARSLTSGHGFDRAIEAIGLPELVKYAPAVLKFGGRFGLYGVESAAEDQAIPQMMVPCGGDWSLWQMWPAEHTSHKEVLDMVECDKIDPAKFITHHLPLSEIEKGFELIGNRHALKVVIDIQ